MSEYLYSLIYYNKNIFMQKLIKRYSYFRNYIFNKNDIKTQ